MKEDEYHSPRECPMVQEALRERGPYDIRVGCCPACGSYSYYSEGPHFSCSWCDYSCGGAALHSMLEAGDIVALADYEEAQCGEEGVP
jgi:hypothetical protein